MLLGQLQQYMQGSSEGWQAAKDQAFAANSWFVPTFIDTACKNIADHLLAPEALQQWADQYAVPMQQAAPKTVGLTMAGNIPLVGFHDWLTLFVAGHRQVIKPSSKDEVLITHLIQYLYQLDPAVKEWMRIEDKLRGCEAYIATGSNNTSRYFEYYFGRYPHIIRRNRTSVAYLDGTEDAATLEALWQDILLYFGLGCRNVSKLYVPEGYAFEPLLHAMHPYHWMKDHSRFRNNFDYNLSLLILNNKPYMSNDIVLLTESEALFSPIAQVHYSYYKPAGEPTSLAQGAADVQCICGRGGVAFGGAQAPGLTDYADGVDTMAFALGL